MAGANIKRTQFGAEPAEASSDTTRSLADLMEGAKVGLALFDASLSLVQCNSRYASLFGYSDETSAGSAPN